MNRYLAVRLDNGKHGVVDTTNNQRVGFSFSNPPLYALEEWGSQIAAEGFAARLSHIPPSPAEDAAAYLRAWDRANGNGRTLWTRRPTVLPTQNPAWFSFDGQKMGRSKLVEMTARLIARAEERERLEAMG